MKSRPLVFICHASEDKVAVARPLAQKLSAAGFRVWFDEYSLRLGDSLRASIDRGLATCRYGIVILSSSFFSKSWTREELDGLTARELLIRRKMILPIWHEIDFADIAAHSPSLAGKLAVRTSLGVPHVVEAIIGTIRDEEERLDIRHFELHTGHGGSIEVLGIANPILSTGPLKASNLDKVMKNIKKMVMQRLKRARNANNERDT